ncbi:MAG: cation:proton antiporter [Thermoprotei archaeon]|nr:MAG: cation:proton antiporter [Thermoprotei archaeon]
MGPQDVLALLFGSSLMVIVADKLGRRLGAAKACGYVTVAALAIALLMSLSAAPGRYKPLPAMGIPVAELRVDEASRIFSVLFASLGLLVAIYSLKYMEGEEGLGAYYLLLLLMVTGMMGVALSNDLFTLYCFWELMSVTAYALVAFRWWHWEPIEAGLKYLVMSTLGALVALYAISMIYGVAGTTNFDELRSLFTTLDDREAIRLLAGLLLFGFGVTAAIAPFHTWLPDAHPAAPSSISAMLSGVVIKAGVYAIARSLLYILPPTSGIGYLLMYVGLLTCTVGNLAALRQLDIKRFLAYSSVANIGYIMVGIGAGYRAHLLGLTHFALAGVAGATLHVINHALGKGLLFLCAGSAIHVIRSRAIPDLEGCGRSMRITGISSAIGLLNLAGIPPLAGFWSKLLIAYGLVGMLWDPLTTAALAIFVANAILAAGYYIYLLMRLYRHKTTGASEVSPLMWGPELVLAAACIILTLLLSQVLVHVYMGASALMGVMG